MAPLKGFASSKYRHVGHSISVCWSLGGSGSGNFGYRLKYQILILLNVGLKEVRALMVRVSDLHGRCQHRIENITRKGANEKPTIGTGGMLQLRATSQRSTN